MGADPRLWVADCLDQLADGTPAVFKQTDDAEPGGIA